MHDKELRELLAQEFEKDPTHFVQIPRGLRSGKDEEFWAWRVMVNTALAAMRRAESAGYQRGMSEAAKHMQ